ncbi:glycosyl transferase family 1 [Afipia sp. P52-10]|nr:glycosyl transferase family 1 [Afipia sp. P52-10]
MRHDPKPRILMTADAVGGVWTYATSLAAGLAADGWRVQLVTMGPKPSPEQLAALPANSLISIVQTELQLEWQDPAGLDIARARTVLAGIAADFSPDVIHCNGYREASYGWRVPTLVAAHSCVQSWARACGVSTFDDEPWLTYRQNIGAGLGSATAWVAPSQAFRSVIARLYQPNKPSRVIYNGIADDAPARAAKRDVILSAGRIWDRGKNLRRLIEIADELDWPLALAGALHEPFSGGKAEPASAHYLGALARPALLDEMHRAAIFVSPARYEPFGLSVLEAASRGCALVLSDIPSFRELWDGAAVFVDPESPGALIRGLTLLCHDDAVRSHLQHLAQERSRRYALTETVRAYQDLYRSLTQTVATADASHSREMTA